MLNFDKFLLAEGILTGEEVARASFLCRKTNSSIVQIILSENILNPKELYLAIAKFENVEFADLKKYPCDKNIVDVKGRDTYGRLKALPWKREGDVIIIATCEKTDALIKWADANFNKYELAITSEFDINDSINSIFEEENNEDAIGMLFKKHPYYSAKNLFSSFGSKIFIFFLALVLSLFIFFPVSTLPFLFAALALFYSATLLFKTTLFLIGILRRSKSEKSQPLISVSDDDLPIYTILVPLFREENTIRKLTDAIKNLNYPKSKLDVKLIVESDDEITINAIKEQKCERIFQIIKVPYSLPQTKPKACNYALRFAKGDYVTIYDAEDVPDPDQLKKVLRVFENSSSDLVCVQAKLNYFNIKENILSRLFAVEYSTLFDFLLFGLEAMKIPIPLGGTSNHFRMNILRELYAWDPYNVTEDADLGIRIAQKGWRCKVINSLTLEEAPVKFGSWIRQRSRWIKGHLQTYFVHMRNPIDLYKKVGVVGFFGVQFFLGAPALIFLISPIMWFVYLLFVLGFISVPENMPAWFDMVIDYSEAMFFVGIALQIFYAVVAISINQKFCDGEDFSYNNKKVLDKNGRAIYEKDFMWKNMMVYSLLFPIYWVLHSIASFKSVWQLITKPYYWEKTEHGVTKVSIEPSSK